MIQDRSLTVLADDQPVTDGCHLRLRGKTTLSLYPDLFLMEIWLLSDAWFYALGNASELQVYHGSELIAFGEISEVARREVAEGELTTVSFGAGLSFWNSFVTLSVPSGSIASETIRRILTASSSDLRLLNWPGADPVFSRGQAFHGRAAEVVETVLSSARAKAVINAAGLQIIPTGGTFEEKIFMLDNHDGPWIMEKR